MKSVVLGILIIVLTPGCKTVKEGTRPVVPESAESDLRKPETMLRIARAAHSGGDDQTAVRFYRRILMQKPDHATALLELAELLLHEGSFHDVHALLDRVMPVDHPERLRLLGKLALGTDQPDQALGFFLALLKQCPHNTYALEGAAIAHDSLGQHEEAHIFYRQTIDLPYTSRTLLSNYGLSLALGGRIDQGVELLRKVCQGDSPTPRDRQNLGIAYALKGDLEQAAQWMGVDLDHDRVRQNLAYLQQTFKTGQKIDLKEIQKPESPPSPLTP